MVTLLVCALSLQGGAIQEPDLAKKVSFKINATRAKPALEALGKIAGFPLLAAQVVQNDVLVINVADVPVGDLMKRIANVTSCDWQRDGAGFRLVRSEAKMRIDEANERRESVDAVRQAIARTVKSNGEQKDMTRAEADKLVQERLAIMDRLQTTENQELNMGAWKEYEKMRSGRPIERLLVRVIAQLDPAQLAAIPPGERRVFAVLPTRMQLRLGPGAQQALADFAQDQAILNEAADNAGLKRDGSEEDSMYGQEFFPWSNPRGKPAKLLVIASRWAESPGISIEARVLDDRGSMVASTSQELGGGEEGPHLPSGVAAKPRPDDKKLELGPITKQLMDYMRAFGGEDGQIPGPEKPVLTGELKQFFLHPELQDPLQLMIGDGLQQIGDQENPNIVACVPDGSFMGMAFIGLGEQPTLRQFKAAIEASRSFAIKKGEGWIEVRPARAASARRDRLDRSDLGQFARAIYSRGSLRLDDLAGFALKAPSRVAEEISQMFTIVLIRDFGGAERQGQWDVLRFYASLTAMQRKAFASAQALTVSSLTPQQRAILTKIVFYAIEQDGEESENAPAELLVPDSQDIAGVAIPAQNVAPEMSLFSPQGRESTEVLPDGLPWEGLVRLGVANADAIRSGSPTMFESDGLNADSIAMYNADSIAMYLAMREKPDLSGFADEDGPNLKDLRLGQRTTYTFNFALDSKYTIRRVLTDTAFTDPKHYSLETLPAPIKKQIDEALIRHREELKDVKGEDVPRMIGPGRPPPPRS